MSTQSSPVRAPVRPFPSYIPSLDGLRGLAVLAVVGFHLALYAPVEAGAGGIVHSVFRFGWVGVDLFFVLSGFLITGILFDNQKGRHHLRAFYGRRFLRIFPLYYAGLAAYVLLAPLFATPDQVAALHESLPWHGGYLTNIRIALAQSWTAAPMHTSHLWSLAVEEQFYLVWPGLIAVVVRWARSPREALMWACGGLVVFTIAFRLWLLPDFAHGAYTLLPARMDTLAVGAFIALWTRGPRGVGPAVAATGPVLFVCAAALAALALATAGTVSYLHPLQQGVGYTLWAALFAAILVHAAAFPEKRFARGLSLAPLVGVGRISYGVYLLHYPLIFVLDSLGIRDFGYPAFCLAVLASSIAAAWMSWRFFESPLLKLKRHFAYDASASDGRDRATRRRTSETIAPVPSS